MNEKLKKNLIEIGTRLRAVRKTLRLTIYEMHQKTRFSKSIISEVENGKRLPSSIYLFALADEFNVNINYLFTGKGEMFLPEEPIFKRDFGRDQEKIEELLFCLENYDVARYNILTAFTQFKRDHQDLLDWEDKEKGEA